MRMIKGAFPFIAALLLAAGAVLTGIAVVGTGVFLESMKRHDLVEHALRNLVILVLMFGTAAVVLRAWNGWPRLALCALLGLLFVDLYVVDRIKGVPTGRSGFHENVPTADVVIRSAEVVS